MVCQTIKNGKPALAGLILAIAAIWALGGYAAESATGGGLVTLSGPQSSDSSAKPHIRAGLPPGQRALLERWYEAVKLRPNEAFGALVARVARVQHGAPYDNPRQIPGSESLRVDLNRFECVSFIESSLAVARCIWLGRENEACFLKELESVRYRDGKLVDFSSRLHYFSDWIIDNDERQTIQNLTPSLGGRPIKRPFYYMSRWVKPILGADDPQTQALAEAEQRLSETDHTVLDREAAPEPLKNLKAGDLVAFVRPGPGLMIRHAGFAWTGSPDKVQLLHASSYHQRVVLTVRDIANYLLRRPERQGVIIARPVAPARD